VHFLISPHSKVKENSALAFIVDTRYMIRIKNSFFIRKTYNNHYNFQSRNMKGQFLLPFFLFTQKIKK